MSLLKNSMVMMEKFVIDLCVIMRLLPRVNSISMTNAYAKERCI